MKQRPPPEAACADLSNQFTQLLRKTQAALAANAQVSQAQCRHLALYLHPCLLAIAESISFDGSVLFINGKSIRMTRMASIRGHVCRTCVYGLAFDTAFDTAWTSIRHSVLWGVRFVCGKG